MEKKHLLLVNLAVTAHSQVTFNGYSSKDSDGNKNSRGNSVFTCKTHLGQDVRDSWFLIKMTILSNRKYPNFLSFKLKNGSGFNHKYVICKHVFFVKFFQKHVHIKQKQK